MNFIILIDTREKHPWGFPPDVMVEPRKLSAGDYSLDGFENRLSIERKTLDDFVQTVIHEKERFRNELLQLQKMEFACVVIEADVRDVFNKRYRCNVNPKSVIGAANAITADYGIPVLFWGTRQHCCCLVENLLRQLLKRFERNK